MRTNILLQVVLLLATCLLACVSCIPFNAAALPGGWHYNGDVGRAPNLAIAVSYCYFSGYLICWQPNLSFIPPPPPRKPSGIIDRCIQNILDPKILQILLLIYHGFFRSMFGQDWSRRSSHLEGRKHWNEKLDKLEGKFY